MHARTPNHNLWFWPKRPPLAYMGLLLSFYYFFTRFSTVNAAPLIFADQFLQLGSVLSTNFVYGLGEHRAKFLLDVNWSKHIMWARDQPPSVSIEALLGVWGNWNKNIHILFISRG